jgi:penicillin-binding protein 1B
VVTEGTARAVATALSSRLPLAGKTGTSNDGRDSWFAGFGGDYLAVVWVGRDDNGRTGLTGASGALRIWTDLMRQIEVTPFRFGRPERLAWLWVAPDGDAVVAENCAGATNIPLALPHGLPERRDCEPGRSPDRKIWDRIRGLFR